MTQQTHPIQQFALLLVTADEDFGASLQAALAPHDFDVTTVVTAEAATLQVSSGRFQVAVVDLKLERPDGGFTLCYHIKKNSPQFPIVLLSDSNSKMGTEFSLESVSDRNWIKADAMLQKPVRLEQLLYELQRLLGIDTASHH